MKHIALIPALTALLLAGVASAQTYYPNYTYPYDYNYYNYYTTPAYTSTYSTYSPYSAYPSYSYSAYPSYSTYPNYDQQAYSYPTYSYPAYSTCGTGYYSYGYGCGENVEIDRLQPSSGKVGRTVKVEGDGFSRYGNTVFFDGTAIPDVPSSDGETLRFTVPEYISTEYGYQPTTKRSYPVSVRNAYGQASNVRDFKVTSGTLADAKPSITSVSGPSSLDVGEVGTWRVSVSAPLGSYVSVSVDWDDNMYPYGYGTATPENVYVSGTQILTFTHVYTRKGDYDVEFSASGPGGSDTEKKEVEVEDVEVLSLSSLSPASGDTGTTITIRGSGFTSSNDIHFGFGGKRNVSSSSNGSRMTFKVPEWISPCDFTTQSGYYCGAPAQPVVPGVYPLYITNANGTTNVLYFRVTD